MNGDFSRNGFQAANHYSAVLLEQGGLLTDSDWREGVDIARHRVEVGTRDVVGPCGGPIDAAAFALAAGARPHAIESNFGSPAQFWVAADDGYVFHTIDGGASWSVVDTGTPRPLFAIRFEGATGWAVGAHGTLVRSTDAGASWSTMAAGSVADLRGVAAAGATQAWAVGDAGTVLLTTDGGTSWTNSSPGSLQLNAVAFQSATRGVVVGAAGGIFTTADGGATWQKRSSPANGELLAVAFVDPDNVWTAGSDGVLLHSGDGGATWTAQSSGTTHALRSLSFSSPTEGIAAGDAGTLLRTTDGGTTWVATASTATADVSSTVLLGTEVWIVARGAPVRRVSVLTGTATDVPLPAASFSIGAGRYYVRGTLCEVDELTSYYNQPDRGPVARLTAGQHIVFVQAWQRLLTAIEAPSIRELALGNVDPSIRTKTVWQVKTLPLPITSPPSSTCATAVPELDALAWPPAARLRARSEPQQVATSLCDIGATAGFRRLENQLYRVEIQQGGATPRFKWSREDGSVEFGIDSIGAPSSGSPVETVVTLRSRARDDNLELSAGDWVEIVNDDLALEARVGPLFQFLRDGSDRMQIVLAGAVPAGLAADPTRHPLLRRWDHRSTRQDSVELLEETWIDLEDGVQVLFEAGGDYRPGDYWVIPARTATADVDWPRNASGVPLARPPAGVENRICRLGLITVAPDGTVSVDADCRHLFPPLTQLDQLLYVSGDGQEGLPGRVLPQPLAVRAARGTFPVQGATVRFEITTGAGSIVGSTTTLDVTTSADGVAQCEWTLDPSLAIAARHQTLTATLLDEGGAALPGTGVVFAANSSFSLVPVGGDGQQAAASGDLEQPLEVRLSHGQVPFDGVQIQFTVVAGGGTITSASPVATLATGIASATWKLGAAGRQRVEAVLQDSANAVVQRVAFNANIEADSQGGGGCAVTVGEEGEVKLLNTATLKELLAKHKGQLCLCFLPGTHEVGAIEVNGENKSRISIHGCGLASRVLMTQSWLFEQFLSFDVSNVAFEMRQKSQLGFQVCEEVALAGLSILAPDNRDVPELEFGKQVTRLRITDTRIRLKVQSLSIVVGDADSSAEICDCDIDGIVSFYGRPAVAKLPLPSLPTDGLLAAMNTGAIRITPGKGRLRLTSNRLDAIAISSEMAATVANAASGASHEIAGVMQDAVLVGNSFDASASQLVSERFALSGNTFMGKPTDKKELAQFVAAGAAVAGNVARESGQTAILFVLTPTGFTQKAANMVFISPP
jgi:photosystem II stability/assembly factor-like uncharacterized protein